MRYENSSTGLLAEERSNELEERSIETIYTETQGVKREDKKNSIPEQQDSARWSYMRVTEPSKDEREEDGGRDKS